VGLRSVGEEQEKTIREIAPFSAYFLHYAVFHPKKARFCLAFFSKPLYDKINGRELLPDTDEKE
jgi:hypothetical protein